MLFRLGLGLARSGSWSASFRLDCGGGRLAERVLFGVAGAWLLQTLYLGICWSYFVYFGLYLTFATAASVIVEGATAVRHAGLPLDIGMLWLLVDLPFLFAWCVVDRRRWRWSAVAALAQFTLFAGLTAQAHRSLQWAAAERDNRYTAPALFIAELGLLPIQVVKAGAQNRSSDFRLWSRSRDHRGDN